MRGIAPAGAPLRAAVLTMLMTAVAAVTAVGCGDSGSTAESPDRSPVARALASSDSIEIPCDVNRRKWMMEKALLDPPDNVVANSLAQIVPTPSGRGPGYKAPLWVRADVTTEIAVVDSGEPVARLAYFNWRAQRSLEAAYQKIVIKPCPNSAGKWSGMPGSIVMSHESPCVRLAVRDGATGGPVKELVLPKGADCPKAAAGA